jgi:hypothetical protein
MEYNDIQPLILAYHRVISSVDLRFKRYLYSQVNWDVRLIGIKGRTWGWENHYVASKN